MILLFTDFGWEGPYVGQMKAALHAADTNVPPLVDLMHDAPAWNPRASAYLLAAAVAHTPVCSPCVLAVVDPGVGGARRAVVIDAGGTRFLGPDNGLGAALIARAREEGATVRAWEIPVSDAAAPTFHGRDVFAPAAVKAWNGVFGGFRPLAAEALDGWDASPDLDEVVYIDRYGNAVTGRRAATRMGDWELRVRGNRLRRARTFAEVDPGTPFWYENSSGLAEIAVNQGCAAGALDLAVGVPISWYNPDIPK